LTRDMASVYLSVFLIFLGIIANIKISIALVKWIREAELEREEAIAQTQHSGRLASIGRLGAGVAHEINNPLAIINEKAGLMKDILLMSPDSHINKETITQRLLGFARRMDVRHEEIDLNDTIREVIEFLDKEILYRNIRLETHLKENLPRIISDKGQLQQVFLNIINNAIDAVEDGGQIMISTELRNPDRIRVSIKDNGQGIAKEKIKHVFEPFYTTKEKGKGTGLGLSITYGIVDRLGGSIHVESEVNVGTTFHVELPIRAEAQ
jgi:two-component system, NtrC family, sensor kinase